ncbi:class F sortase [Candidatus Parcubacteria bacterium]|nr:class F sortase [Candidatus Parcubacteria bacterium]
MTPSNTSSSKKIVLLMVFALLLIGGGFYFLYNLYQQNNFPMPFENQNQTASLSNSGLPTRLSIPSINVDAPIIQVALDKNGDVDTPKGPSEVAWYKLGPRPGDEGSAILTGHFGPWLDGSHSVFDNLEDIKTGDKIYVKDDKGNTKIFEVKSRREYNPDDKASEVFNDSSGMHLNLITCHGDWLANQKTYNKRLVIFTELVS